MKTINEKIQIAVLAGENVYADVLCREEFIKEGAYVL